MIYLLFSIHGGNQFQGLAKMAGVVAAGKPKEFLAQGLPATITVEWIKRFVEIPWLLFEKCVLLIYKND